MADPDPWRDRLRAAWMDSTALRALADEPGLEGQSAEPESRGHLLVLQLQSEALLAMTYQRLGLKAEAGRLVSGCRAALQKKGGGASVWGPEWHAYLACELFCREAEALIREDTQTARGKPSDPTSEGASSPLTTNGVTKVSRP